ncbi:MAG: hypothetical protein ACRBEE_02290 [Arenicella sp.]
MMLKRNITMFVVSLSFVALTACHHHAPGPKPPLPGKAKVKKPSGPSLPRLPRLPGL